MSKYILTSFLFICFFALPQFVYAETSLYRSAGWVATDGTPAYTDTSSCQQSDSNYCSRPQANNHANLYFSSFGNLAAFGIPQNATITKVHIRIKGKNTITQYVGVNNSKNYSPFLGQCQIPSDLWRFYLGSVETTIELHTATAGNGLADCITAATIDQERLTFRINYSSISPWASDIDNFEVAFDYTPAAITSTPTSLPTATPQPSPTAIPTQEPFLELPWDYQSQGKNFENIVFNPNSWFDHQYPLQNFCCEPPILDYTGKLNNTRYYRSHSGYDYGLTHGVRLGTSVLAAAAGLATFEPAAMTNGGGNIIKIDHGNGYQTWYEHLSTNNLFVSTVGDKKFVERGQKLGEVGMTGNTNGPHIHLSVFKDINNNGNFKDDYPYGLVDPLGWVGNYPDPWTQYGSGGAESHPLFISLQKTPEKQIETTGGSLQTTDKKVEVVVPPAATEEPFSLHFTNGPFESFSSNGSLFESIVPSFFLEATNGIGEKLTQFYQPIRIIYRYSDADLLNFEENSLLLYVLNEETGKWEALPSILDIDKRTITAETTHFSHFALIGKVKDAIPPTTEITIKGTKGKDKWYQSDISIEMHSKDNETGVGIEYTLYSVDGSEWKIYTSPITLGEEGMHSVNYQAVDKAGNEEEIKTTEIWIDKTPPEAVISYNLTNFDIVIAGKDGSNSTTVVNNKKAPQRYIVTDDAGNMLTILLEKVKAGKQITLSLKSLQYNTQPVQTVDKNIFFTLVSLDKNKKVKQLEQYFSLKKDKKIFTHYVSSTDTTKIYILQGGEFRYSQLDKAGIVLLQLETEQGKLKYKY